MNAIVIAIIVLGSIGIVCALVLYVVSTRFRVEEDPRIAQVESILPGANCGGCGFNGCHDFACRCVAADSLVGLNCPGAGSEGMKRIADLLGLTAQATVAKVAVVKCNGTCDVRPTVARYDGAMSCAVAAMAGAGEGSCPNGCLGCGDCVAACSWDALRIDTTTGLPVVDQDKCTGCNQCVLACPRSVIELRPRGPRNLRVWVACNNKEKGAVGMKECKVGCIACGKCARTCSFDAIKVENNLAWIDPDKCRLCTKCVDECPTGAIHKANFPTRKPKPQTEETASR